MISHEGVHALSVMHDEPMICEPNQSSQVRAEIFAHLRTVGAEGLQPEASQLARMRTALARVEHWPADEAYEQLTPVLCGRHPQAALQLMRECGLLARLLPELDATAELSHDADGRHKDVWEHTKIVVWQSVPQPSVRWAAALHDIGKVPTRRLLPDGRVTFHNHAELGERMFEAGPATRIAFPAKLRSRIAELIRWHQRPGYYEAGWSDSAVRRFAREVGPALDELLNLSRADITSRIPGRRKQCLRSISELSRRIRALELEDRKVDPLPAGLGRHLMSAFELAPGPAIGAMRARLQQLCAAGELEPGRAPEYYIEALRERALRSQS